MKTTSSPNNSSLGFLFGMFFSRNKNQKKTIRFQKPSKPRSPPCHISQSWTQLLTHPGRAVCCLAATPKSFERLWKILQQGRSGIPERRVGKRQITHKCKHFQHLMFCHSYGISWRCRGWDHANAVKCHIFFAFWDESKSLIWLVVGFNRSEKICSSNWTSSSIFGVKIPKIFELPPPSFYFIHTLREDSFLSHRFLT